jgi:hypothetical protein
MAYSSRVSTCEVLYRRSIKVESNLWLPLQNHLLGGEPHRIWNVATRPLLICQLNSLALISCCALPLHLEHNPDTHHKNIKNNSGKYSEYLYISDFYFYFYFYFWGLRPVASITTTFGGRRQSQQYFFRTWFLLLVLFHTHNKFRPVRAIFRCSYSVALFHLKMACRGRNM